jgi:hypothetical protein
MNGNPRFLLFGWWNLHNFAHFDSAKISHKRWPKTQRDYEAKRDCILTALREVFGNRSPHLLALCEITREAARDLAAHLPGGDQLALPPRTPGNLRGVSDHLPIIGRLVLREASA